MASTYTENTGIEKPGAGEQAGAWGTTTNSNFDIIDRALHGQLSLTITGDTDLTTNDGSNSNGVNPVVFLTGTPSSAFELRIDPTDQKKHYTIKNSTGQTCTVVHKGPNTPNTCLLYTSPSPRDGLLSRMPSSA